ncbi:MAG: TraR/DksA C4-type zinc finger protein [Myxococcota bacterium]|nr:TraR/DksA C4-type zinc finger protein [Myxococcota bacterium]
MTTIVPGDNREEPGFDGVSEEELAKRKEEFRTLLFQERQRLMRNAQRTLTEEMTVDQEDLADEMDLASADYNQNLSFRLRGRERHLLVKIEEALERVDDESYWECEECGAWIGFRRLRARPVTTLCILCKEKQEHRERAYA